jgi:ABC-2 type transport system permease protein/lipopolysaccharide transport system permease protein
MQAELLRTLVERQVRLRSKRSVFGVAWPLAAPLFLLGLYLVVFGSVFDVPVDHYGIYLFAGLLPWTFLVQASHDALQSISFEPDLVRRAPLPYHYLPLARVAVMAIPFLVLLTAFVVYVLVGDDVPVRAALLPVLALPLASVVLLVATIAMLLALLDVFSRDLRYVLHNVLTVWFFLVPIVYSRRMMSDRMRTFTAADPMRRIVDQFRDVLYDGKVESLLPHVATLAACAAAFVVGLTLFRRLAVDLAKDV